MGLIRQSGSLSRIPSSAFELRSASCRCFLGARPCQGNDVTISDSGSKRMPPTLSPPDARWMHCWKNGVHIDRYVPVDSGAAQQASWMLDLPDSLLLPFCTTRNMCQLQLWFAWDAMAKATFKQSFKVQLLDRWLAEYSQNIVFVWLTRTDQVDLTVPEDPKWGSSCTSSMEHFLT